MVRTPEEDRQDREEHEPSNMAVIGAYAQSDHLQLFYVGNTAQEKIYVIASAWRNAIIIAMMGGHIRSLKNAQRWKPMLPTENGSAVAQAIKDGLPGVLWVRKGCVIMHHKVFYDRK